MRLLEISFYCLYHFSYIKQDILILETKHLIPHLFEFILAYGICLLLLCGKMVASIDLNNQLGLSKEKIHYIISYNILSPAFLPKTFCPGNRPKSRFCLSHFFTIGFGILLQQGIIVSVSCLPSHKVIQKVSLREI